MADAKRPANGDVGTCDVTYQSPSKSSVVVSLAAGQCQTAAAPRVAPIRSAPRSTTRRAIPAARRTLAASVRASVFMSSHTSLPMRANPCTVVLATSPISCIGIYYHNNRRL